MFLNPFCSFRSFLESEYGYRAVWIEARLLLGFRTKSPSFQQVSPKGTGIHKTRKSRRSDSQLWSNNDGLPPFKMSMNGIYQMNPAILSALAALGGSSVGALSPILSSYVLQRSQAQRDLLVRQVVERETLYSDFINEASRVYAHSQTHNLECLDELVSLYARVSRIRLLGTEPVINAAEVLVRQIVKQYGEPNLTIEETRAAAIAAKADPLDVFSFACRGELEEILIRGSLSSMVHL